MRIKANGQVTRFLRLALTLLFVLSLGCSHSPAPSAPPGVDPLQQAMDEGRNPQRKELVALGIGGATIEVEVAGETSAGSSLGLMFRKEMGANEGMWFEFPDNEYLKFWMRNTNLPLSIAFVDAKGVISNIEDMVPHDESLVRSRRKVRYALEMNRGWFAIHGIKAGDLVRVGSRKPNPKAGKP